MLAEYEDYARESLKKFAEGEAAARYSMVEAVADCRPARVLDLGCGAGQELLPFLERTGAVCVGVDRAEKLGAVTMEVFQGKERSVFVRAEGENLPLETVSFDVVLCRVALPYMNNRETLAEISRVLKPGGVLLLKTHAPLFYLGMIRQRLKTRSPKQLAYPLIRKDRSYVLQVWFETGGRRLTSQVVLEGQETKVINATTAPVTQPSTRPATGPASEPARP